MQKKIQRPENWQDFESLCKMLWGEIWQCDEIQKNGRSGQTQNGVDVYGIPLNEVAYFGIQCKGKDDYLNLNFTDKEVDQAYYKFSPEGKFLDRSTDLYYLNNILDDRIFEFFPDGSKYITASSGVIYNINMTTNSNFTAG